MAPTSHGSTPHTSMQAQPPPGGALGQQNGMVFVIVLRKIAGHSYAKHWCEFDYLTLRCGWPDQAV